MVLYTHNWKNFLLTGRGLTSKSVDKYSPYAKIFGAFNGVLDKVFLSESKESSTNSKLQA